MLDLHTWNTEGVWFDTNDIAPMAHVLCLWCSFVISEHLSGLRRLNYLSLSDIQTAEFGGGVEHLPVLHMLAISGIGASGATVASTSLMGLITGGINVRSVDHPHLCLECILGGSDKQTCCHACCTCAQDLHHASVSCLTQSNKAHGVFAGPRGKP